MKKQISAFLGFLFIGFFLSSCNHKKTTKDITNQKWILYKKVIEKSTKNEPSKLITYDSTFTKFQKKEVIIFYKNQRGILFKNNNKLPFTWEYKRSMNNDIIMESGIYKGAEIQISDNSSLSLMFIRHSFPETFILNEFFLSSKSNIWSITPRPIYKIVKH